MANTKRRAGYIDTNGNMFMPMSVEGGAWKENFLTTPKMLCIAGIIAVLVFIMASLSAEEASIRKYLVYILIWAVISLYLIRFVVFEEKFYYKMYKEMQKYEISSPAVFWNIASIKDTDDGAIINFSDARIGVMVKVERDTITGKKQNFREDHYDAISDFYKSLVQNRYSFMQIDIMEKAGKDPRLNELAKLVNKSSNPNINKLMELEIGHIKNITNVSLCESDYFLFYTSEISKTDYIIQDIAESMFKIMDGAYVGFQVLSSRGIVDIVKEIYGVNYFNSTEASLTMFGKTDNSVDKIPPMTLIGVVWDDGYVQELNNKEKAKISNITNSVLYGNLDVDKMALKKAIYRKDNKRKVGISFDMLSKDENANEIAKEKEVNKNKYAGNDEYIDF